MVWNQYIAGPQPSVGLIVSISTVSLFVILAGALLAYDPALYIGRSSD